MKVGENRGKINEGKRSKGTKQINQTERFMEGCRKQGGKG